MVNGAYQHYTLLERRTYLIFSALFTIVPLSSNPRGFGE